MFCSGIAQFVLLCYVLRIVSSVTDSRVIFVVSFRFVDLSIIFFNMPLVRVSDVRRLRSFVREFGQTFFIKYLFIRRFAAFFPQYHLRRISLKYIIHYYNCVHFGIQFA